MKKIKRDSIKLELAPILDLITKKINSSVCNKDSDKKISEVILTTINEIRSNPRLQHGLHVEKMFSYVAGALNECAIIKSEDSGMLLTQEADVIAPDYRVITNKGYQFFVEVKNNHHNIFDNDYVIKKEYWNKISKYSEIMGLDVKIAIYWSQFHQWTLNSISSFTKDNNNYLLNFSKAIKQNEMNVLGDSLLGTSAPLILKLFNGLNNPIKYNADNEYLIKDIEILNNRNVPITNEIEKRIAWILCLFGNWSCENPTVELENSILKSISYIFYPQENDRTQEYDIIGMQSEIISKQYIQTTTMNGIITQFESDSNVDNFGTFIPTDYSGETLPLWRFTINPNY